MIPDLDIDGSLPGDGQSGGDGPPTPTTIRRDRGPPVPASGERASEAVGEEELDHESTWPLETDEEETYEKLSLIAGAGFTTLLAYFYFVIGTEDGDALRYAILIAVLVVVAIWFYLRGTEMMDPVKAHFLAGVIGILAVIVLWQGQSQDVDFQYLLVSGLLAGVSTLCILQAAMKRQ